MQWDAEQDDDGSDDGVSWLVGEGEDEQDYRGNDEQKWKNWIAPDTIGSYRVRFTPAKDEDGAGCECIEKPFGEDSEREESLEASYDKQEQCA